MSPKHNPLLELLNEIRDCTSCVLFLSAAEPGATFDELKEMLQLAIKRHRKHHMNSYSV